MAKFWRSPSGKIIVSAAGKPIDCPDCPCEPQPVTSLCCGDVSLPASIDVTFTVTSGACVDLDGQTVTLRHRSFDYGGGPVYECGLYNYEPDGWVSDPISVGGESVRIGVACDPGSAQYFIFFAAADCMSNYGSETYLSLHCCCPLLMAGSIAGLEIGTCSIDVDVSIGPKTVYLTLSGATGGCAFINGVWPLDWDGVIYWEHFYLDGGNSLGIQMQCGSPTNNLRILISTGAFEACAPEDGGAGTINYMPECPFVGQSGTAEIVGLDGAPCSCAGQTISWSLAV